MALCEGIEPTPGATPSWRSAVVSDDRQQGAGTSGKAESLIRIRDANDTGRQMALGQR